MLRTNVHEMNVEAVDLGEEIGVGVQLRLDLAPVVLGRPIPRERLNEGELHALRKIGDGFLLGQPRGLDAPAQLDKIGFRKVHLKRTNIGTAAGLACGISSELQSWSSHGFQPPGKA